VLKKIAPLKKDRSLHFSEMSDVFKETTDKLTAKIDALNEGTWVFDLCSYWICVTNWVYEAEQQVVRGIFGDNLEPLVTGFSELCETLQELRETIVKIAELDGEKSGYLSEEMDDSGSLASDMKCQCEIFDHVSRLFLSILRNKT
jgi:hypothetical protein